jgi:dipeptidyl aminopeptidase/acylaminoacyl peptidase
LRTFGWIPASDAIVSIANVAGHLSLRRYPVDGTPYEAPPGFDTYADFSQISVHPHDGALAVLASAPTIPPRVLAECDAAVRVVRRAASENIPPGSLAAAEAITWTGADGGLVHGLYYAPAGPPDRLTEPPPLMVLVHGGPTSQRTMRYDPNAQYFATRGYAVLQVNHRGSTGYGRDYMNALRHAWGTFDVEDARTGAEALAARGLAGRGKVAIMGGSAGGFTVLQSLVSHPGFYRAGIALYPVSNQFSLATDTHKFEAHYNEWLLGPLPAAAEVYRARSPEFHAEHIVDPLLILHGEEDRAVPIGQSEAIVARLRRNGTPHVYRTFAGEGHGFRRAETIEATYQEIDRFLRTWLVYA